MIFERTLPNGLEIVVQPTDAPVAALQVWVDVGSIDERPAEAGYCHFLEHMLFKGTKRRTTQQIAGTVEGAGGEMNAFTSFEYTVYHITLSNDRWEVANEILADMVLGSIFKPLEFRPEKEVILEEIKRSDDSADRQLYQGIYSRLYGEGGYGRPVIGFPSTVKRCTAEGLKAFWRRWYSPQLMTLVVCGDVDPIKIEKAATKTWGRATGKALRPRRRDFGYRPRVATSRSAYQAMPFPVSSVRWAAALPSCDIRDKMLPALDVSGLILGSGDASRLHDRLYRKEHLVSSVGAGVWAPAGPGMYTFDAEVPVEKVDRFRNALWDEVERFVEEGPTKEELDRTKSALEADRIFSQQTMEGLAHRLGYLKASVGDLRFDLEYLSQTRDLTTDEVREAARSYLKEKTPIEFALLPPGMESKSIWKEGRATSPKAAAPAATKARPTKEVVREKISLPNGIELVLYPRDDLPIVSISTCALGGQRAENRGTAGIGNLLADVWDKAPEGWTSAKFADFEERLGARISAFSGRNSFGLNTTFLSRDTEEVLPIYLKTLLTPEFAVEDFSRAKDLSLEEIKTLEDDLGRLVSKLFSETMFDGHPYGFPMVGFKESIEAVTQQKLKDYFRENFRRVPLTVSVSGKFHTKKVVSAFEALARGDLAKTPTRSLSFEAPKANRYAEVKKGREQTHLVIGYPGLRITDEDRYALRLLLTVLGGQSGRLFTEVRDKKGLCYTVAPMSSEGIEPGYVAVYMACDPTKREAGISGILAELDKISTKPIGPAELKRSKEFLLGRHHMDMQLCSAISSTAALNTLYGLPFDEHLKWREAILRLSAADLRRLARRIFSSPSVTAVVI